MEPRDSEQNALDWWRRTVDQNGTRYLFLDELRTWSDQSVHPFPVHQPPVIPYVPSRLLWTRESPSEPIRVPLPKFSRTVLHVSVPVLDDVPGLWSVLVNVLSSRRVRVSWEWVRTVDGKVGWFVGVPRRRGLVGVVEQAFRHVSPDASVVVVDDPLSIIGVGGGLWVREYYAPIPWYHRLVVNGGRGGGSFLSDVVLALDDLGVRVFGCLQVLACSLSMGASRVVRANANALLLSESASELGDLLPYQRTSGAVRKPLEEPLVLVVVRVVSSSKDGARSLDGAVRGSLSWSGQRLHCRTEGHFKTVLSEEQVRGMVVGRYAHATGMLLASSSELAPLLTPPGVGLVERIGGRLTSLLEFPIPQLLLNGSGPVLGSAAGRTVRLPEGVMPSVPVIGASGSGKTTFLLRMALESVRREECVIVVDPHGEASEDFLGLIPDEHAHRVVYVNPAVPGLRWNPLQPEEGEDIGVVSMAVAASFADAYGDVSLKQRGLHLLAKAVAALIVLNKGLADLPLLYARTPTGNTLRHDLTRLLEGREGLGEVLRFWRDDFLAFPKSAFTPITSRLSNALMHEPTRRLLSRSESALSFSHLIRSRRVVIIALPVGNLGQEIVSLVGNILVNAVLRAALRQIPSPVRERVPVMLIVDEVHRFKTSTKALVSVVDECRKAKTFFLCATQALAKLPPELIAALESIPNRVVFHANPEDASHIARVAGMPGLAQTIMTLPVGQAIATINGNTLRLTATPLGTPSRERAHATKQASLAQYYATTPGPLATPARPMRRREYDTI